MAPSECLAGTFGLPYPADLGVDVDFRLESESRESSLFTHALSHCASCAFFFESDRDDDEEEISLRLRARPLQLFSGSKAAGT
jgi:hypothetical protein